MGYFEPGGVATITSIRSLSAQMTHAHERGHQVLCVTTSIGYYITVLSQALSRVPDAKQQLNETLNRFIDACWVTQEGYATLRQVTYCLMNDKSADVPRFLALLPESYKTALEVFNRLGDGKSLLAHAHRIYGTRFSGKALDTVIGLSLESVGYVAARVAMSLPISDALMKSEALPCPRIADIIDADSPDERLERALKAIDSEMFEEISESCLDAERRTVAGSTHLGSVTPRLMDDNYDRLAQKLAAAASLTYEPSYRVNMVPAVKRILKVNIVDDVDARDLQLDQHIQDSEIRIASTEDPLQLPGEDPLQIGWRIREFELCAAGITNPQRKLPPVPPVKAIVFEILPDKPEGYFCIWVTAYSDGKMFNACLRTIGQAGLLVAENGAAYPIARGRTGAIDRKFLKALPKVLTSEAHYWLVAEPYLEMLRERREGEVETFGQVIVIDKFGDHPSELSGWDVHRLRHVSHSAVMGLDMMPPGLNLRMCRYRARYDATVFKAVLSVGRNEGEYGDFASSCIGDALFRSATNKVLFFSEKKGTTS